MFLTIHYHLKYHFYHFYNQNMLYFTLLDLFFCGWNFKFNPIIWKSTLKNIVLYYNTDNTLKLSSFEIKTYVFLTIFVYISFCRGTLFIKLSQASSFLHYFFNTRSTFLLSHQRFFLSIVWIMCHIIITISFSTNFAQ